MKYFEEYLIFSSEWCIILSDINARRTALMILNEVEVINMTGFGERLAELLKKRGMKQTDLCELTGIPKSAISQYVSGKIEPRQDRVREIADILEVDPAWLVGFKPAELSERELWLIDIYRSNETARAAIEKVAEEYMLVFRAAKSENGDIVPVSEFMARKRLEQIKNAPETDEELL